MAPPSRMPRDFVERAHEFTAKQWAAIANVTASQVYVWAHQAGVRVKRGIRMPDDFPRRAHERTAMQWAIDLHAEECTVRRWARQTGVRCRPARAAA